MAYSLNLDEEGILNVTINGEFTEDQLSSYIHDLNEIVSGVPAGQNLKSFIDTTELGRVNPNLRRMTGDIMDDPRLGATAVLGNSRVVKVMIDFVLKASGRDHMHYFTNRNEALSWLKSC